MKKEWIFIVPISLLFSCQQPVTDTTKIDDDKITSEVKSVMNDYKNGILAADAETHIL